MARQSLAQSLKTKVQKRISPTLNFSLEAFIPSIAYNNFMDFELNEEQQMVRNSVREYAQNEIAPVAREYDEQEKFPRPQLDGLAELGLLGMIIPEEYGGAGFDSVSYAVALEEIAAADSSVAVIVSVTNSVCCYPILSFGTEEHKRKYLVALA
jgi:alkylation response protein AidB-like acyl-CoA dehydrogenase